MKSVSAYLLCFGLLLSGTDIAPAQDGADALAVRELLRRTYEKADAPLGLHAIVIENDLAVADWSQGDLAGRALLRRSNNGAWTIALCGGDALRDAANLEKVGADKTTARALSERLAAAEKSIEPALLGRMSRFDGLVAVDAANGHTPVDPAHIPIR